MLGFATEGDIFPRSGAIGAYCSDIAAQVLSAIAIALITLRAPTIAQLAERMAVGTPARRTGDDDFYDDVEKCMEALNDAITENAPIHLRAALADRDPAVVQATRYTVVEAIRVLHEGGQIDADDSEWMLRESLRTP